MAESSPASTHSWRNTELSAWRMAGLRPKLTLETPSTVYTPGSSALMRRIASMVSMPSRRRSSWPAPSGNVRASKIRSPGSRPYSFTARSWIRFATRTFQSAVAGLALLVDGEADDSGAVLPGQGEDPVAARAGRLPVLQVGGVEHRPAADVLQAGLQHRRLGRVEHQGEGGGGGEAPGDLVHVGHPVAADVVDADVEDVGAFLHLLLGDLHAGVPVAGQHGLPELLRAVGVGPLADRQVGGVLGEGHCGVDGRAARLHHRFPPDGRAAPHRVDHTAEVLRRRAAAAADDVDAELGGEAVVGGGQLVRGEVVVGGAVDDRRQPGVGQARQERAGLARQVPQMLGHLPGAGGAVEPDDVGPQRLQRGQRGADLGADQHPAGGLHRHLDHERHGLVRLGHGPPAGDHRRFGLEEVVDRLDQQDVDAAGQQPRDLGLVAVAQRDEVDLTERRQLRAGADRPDDPAGPVGRGVARRHLLGDAGRLLVDLAGALRDPVLRQHHREGAEGVGLDGVDANFEEAPVEIGDDLGPGHGQDLVAAFEGRAAEVLRAEVAGLEVGAGGAVEDDDPFAQSVKERPHGEIKATGGSLKSWMRCPVLDSGSP